MRAHLHAFIVTMEGIMSTSFKRFSYTAAFAAFAVAASALAPTAAAATQGADASTAATVLGTRLPADRNDDPGGQNSPSGQNDSDGASPQSGSPTPEESEGPSQEPSNNTENKASPGSPGATPADAPSAGATPADTPSTPTGDFDIDGNGKLVRYKGSATDVTIPDSVKVIGEYAFKQTGVVKAKVPATVVEIEKGAFFGCSALRTVEFEDTDAKPSQLAKIGELAFYRTGAFKETALPRSVTSLGRAVFSKSGIQKISLPAGVTEISDEAFFRATSLNDVAISDNVEKIGYRAFGRTGSLKALKVVGANGQVSTGFPSKLKALGGYAFWYSPITEVTFPAGMESIGESAFNRSNLTKLTFNKDLKSIGDGAFAGTDVTDLTIPDSVVEAKGAMRAMRKLVTLHIGKGVGPDQLDGSFFGTKSLKTITVSQENPNYKIIANVLFNGEGTKLIAIPLGRTFDNDTVKKYRVPTGVKEIADSAFFGSDFKEIDFPSSVRTIGDYAFSNSALKRLELPSSVESIGENAFADCTSLESADVGGAVKIGKFGFSRDSALKTVNLHPELNKLKEIGAYAFEYSGLEKAMTPDSLATIGQYAFIGNQSLLEIRLGSGLATIEEMALADTPKLRSIEVAEGNPVFSDDSRKMLYAKRENGLHLVACAGGSVGSDVRVKDGTVAIGDSAFFGVTSMRSLHLPEGLKTLGSRSFEEATNLSNVDFPDSLEVVGGFNRINSLHKVDFGTQITSIEGAFIGRTPERIVVRGGKNGKYDQTYGNSNETVSAYFGEGMTDIRYTDGRLPKVLVLPSTLKEFEPGGGTSGNEARRASAVFYVAAEPGSSAWKLAQEKMLNAGMDPNKQLKRYTPMSVSTQSRTSQGKVTVTVNVRGGVTEGSHQARILTVGSGSTKASEWVDAKSVGDGYQATLTYDIPTSGQKIKVEVRDHTELTVQKDVTSGNDPEPSPTPTASPSSSPSVSPTASPTASPTSTSSPTATASPTAQPGAPSAKNAFVIDGKEVLFGRAGDTPLVGDWDGDGIATPGVKRGNTYYLVNSIRGGKADVVFSYGRAGDTPLVGDWDGDGSQTISVRRGHTFYLNTGLEGGSAEATFMFGRDGDTPVVGDWNGDGKDTLAVRRGAVFYFTDRLAGGKATSEFTVGDGKEIALAGRWVSGQKADTIGLVSDGTFQILDQKGTGGYSTQVARAPRYLSGVFADKAPDTLALHG